MIIIAGHVFTDPADIHALVADARATLPKARAFDGCLFFSQTLDDPDAGSMLVFEQWRDEAALTAYLAQPHVVDIFARWADRMRNEVRKFDVANERNP